METKMIQVKYYFKEHPKTSLSVFLKDQKEVDAFKQKHPNYVYVEHDLWTFC